MWKLIFILLLCKKSKYHIYTEWPSLAISQFFLHQYDWCSSINSFYLQQKLPDFDMYQYLKIILPFAWNTFLSHLRYKVHNCTAQCLLNYHVAAMTCATLPKSACELVCRNQVHLRPVQPSPVHFLHRLYPTVKVKSAFWFFFRFRFWSIELFVITSSWLKVNAL